VYDGPGRRISGGRLAKGLRAARGSREELAMRKMKWIIAVVMGLGVLGALHTSEARADEVVYEKHTVVDFGDDTIDGNLSKPDGQYLEARKRQKQIRLIKVRESFRAEILQSVRVL
jgi:hypothetical protein